MSLKLVICSALLVLSLTIPELAFAKGIHTEYVKKSEEGLVIGIQYHHPYWGIFPKRLTWNVSTQCQTVSEITNLQITIDYSEVRPCPNCLTQEVSFPSKTFEFANKDLCEGNGYDRVFINGVEL